LSAVHCLTVGPLATNCYILESGQDLAVIDPGGDAARILAKAGELGGKVGLVINTHGHIDHVAADGELVAATGAELLIHRADAAMLEHPETGLAALMGVRMSTVKPTRLLSDGEDVAVGDVMLRVLHTPGHTPGGVCLLGPGFAFTGDTLFLDSVGRTDFPGGSEARLRGSLTLLRARLAGETTLYPGHGDSGSFTRALLINPFLGSAWPLD
jgi:glyoxylase-like metal-dependent hydrolase (beta-lactamase superfamily II)